MTRDRREGDANLLGLEFRVIDTAGYEDEDPASLPGRMRPQTEAAVRDADVALFLIDAREGLTPLDEEIARWLRAGSDAGDRRRQQGRRARRRGRAARGLCARARRAARDQRRAWRGRGRPVRSAAAACRARDEDEPETSEDDEGGPLKLAIVGRPNAGKSTLVNRMLGEERMITGPEAGITRDSISLDWEWNGPAGPAGRYRGPAQARQGRRQARTAVGADTRRAIDHAEVVVLLLDATRGLEVQDLKIADAVIEEGRALIIAVNKWDVAENASSLFNGIKAALEEGLSQLKGVPVLTVSAKTGKGIDQILEAAFELARGLVAARLDRRAQPLVRGGGRSQSAARAQGQADQAALHHPGEDPAAELRRVRQPRRRAARQLSPLSGQRAAPRSRSSARCRCG